MQRTAAPGFEFHPNAAGEECGSPGTPRAAWGPYRLGQIQVAADPGRGGKRTATVMTPSLPTFSIARAMRSPISRSPLAEMVATCSGETEVAAARSSAPSRAHQESASAVK